jgi:hypothetical protein
VLLRPVQADVGGVHQVRRHVDCDEEVAARVAARISDAVDRLGVLCNPDTGTILQVSTGTAELSEALTRRVVRVEGSWASSDIGFPSAGRWAEYIVLFVRSVHCPPGVAQGSPGAVGTLPAREKEHP